MSFIHPMNASPLPKNWKFTRDAWVAERKFDGHRLVAQVGGGPARDLFTSKLVVAWARSGIERKLPEQILRALTVLPDGIYDGELCVPGGRSYGVTELTQTNNLEYVIFDVLELLGHSTVHKTYDERRAFLEEMFTREHINGHSAIKLADSWPISSMDDVDRLKEDVWAEDGEGLILKRRAARYQPGKRSKDFIKIKKCDSAVLTVIGFEPSKGKIMDRGPFGTTVIQDDDGNITTVKTLNDFELDRLEKEDTPGIERHWKTVRVVGKGAVKMHTNHPAVGRKLRIEFQERTPDMSYREPRWDRWEDE
jgi:ATP-dependent DNA ligase